MKAAAATPCIGPDCPNPPVVGHFLCNACWKRLPITIATDIARARVAGDQRAIDAGRDDAVRHLTAADAAYATIARTLGEHDPETEAA